MINKFATPQPERFFQKNWVGVCGQLPKLEEGLAAAARAPYVLVVLYPLHWFPTLHSWEWAKMGSYRHVHNRT